MKIFFFSLLALLATRAYSETTDVCERAVRRETTKLQRAAEQADPAYTFDGIGDIDQEDEETYNVTFGFNGQCQGGYQFLIQKSDDGASCSILATAELPGEC
jgi:hypothetical protein